MKRMIAVVMAILSAPALADSIKSTAILCRSETSCGIAWSKALQWVTQNSRYKVRMVNDYMIDTFGPNEGYGGLGFTVQRVVINGQIGISLTTRCLTSAGIGGLFAIECDSDEQSYLDSFVKFLATDPPPQSVGERNPDE